MRWFPPIEPSTDHWRLPLCDATARAVELALLAWPADSPHGPFSALCRRDPSFALWACWSAVDADAAAEASDPPRCKAVSDWLTESFRRHFSHTWSAGAVEKPSPTERPSLADAAGDAVAVAHVARQLAEAAADKSLDPEQAYLAGLLSMSRPLLRGGDALPTRTSDLTTVIPPWLARLFHCVEGDDSSIGGSVTGDRTPLADCVRRAVRLVATDQQAPREENGDLAQLDLQAVQAARQAATAHWLAEDDDVWIRLAGVTDLVRRLDQIEASFEERLEREKLDAMKELAYGASHEINNPLANISARAQMLIKDEVDPQRRRKLSAINAQAYRAHEMISDLMLFARPPRIDGDRVDPDQLIDEVMDELRPTLAERAISIHHDRADGTSSVWGDRVQLGVALAALCKNAIEAMGIGGHLELTARTEPGGWAEITVRDDGPGITPEVRRHIFDPFYSGREAGRGLGFGLSKTWRIVTEHGGQIEVDSQPGHGATFTIRLPQSELPEPAAC